MKKPFLLGSVVALSLLYFSCSNGTNKETTQTPNAIQLDSAAQNFPQGGGQRVPLAQILPCLDAYAQVMATYGITPDSPSVPFTKCPPMTYRITTTEGLTYATFKSWLDSIVAVIDPVGKGSNVWLKIQPGISTQQLVTAVGAPASRTGRITYFIVPALIDSSKAKANSGDPDGYDVGGLHP